MKENKSDFLLIISPLRWREDVTTLLSAKMFAVEEHKCLVMDLLFAPSCGKIYFSSVGWKNKHHYSYIFQDSPIP